MDRAADDRAQAPEWLPDSFLKSDGAPDVQFEGYQYFTFPMDHGEFSRTGVIGNPMRATAEKGEEALERFSDHLVRAIDEFRAADGRGAPARVRGARVSTTPPALRRAADPRAHPARRRRVGRRPRARSHGVLDHRPPRPRAALARRARRARARRRAGAAGRRAGDRDPAHRLGAARGGQPRREGDDRRPRRARGPLGLDDLPRLLVVVPGAGAAAGERARDRPHAGHELAGDRLRARRRADPRDRHARRARPAHAAARRPLDDRLPGRAELRARVLLVRGRDAGRRADDVAAARSPTSSTSRARTRRGRSG